MRLPYVVSIDFWQYKVEVAVKMTDGKLSLFTFQSVTDESKRTEDTATWSAWLDEYTQRLRQEEEGVADIQEANTDRCTVMNATNPR